MFAARTHLFMERVNATINDTHREQLDTVKENAADDISDAEAARRLFDRAQQANELEQKLHDQRTAHEQERDELEQEITDLEHQITDLRNQLAAANTRVDQHQELVEYVREERSITAQRAQAGLFTKTKWALFGMPADD